MKNLIERWQQVIDICNLAASAERRACASKIGATFFINMYEYWSLQSHLVQFVIPSLSKDSSTCRYNKIKMNQLYLITRYSQTYFFMATLLRSFAISNRAIEVLMFSTSANFNIVMAKTHWNWISLSYFYSIENFGITNFSDFNKRV